MISSSDIPVDRALAEALALSAQGLPCFPCSASKAPITPHGFKDATADRNDLALLWRLHPGPLVGVPTGDASGLNVLDIDARHGGRGWFSENRARLPATRVHRTRSGGLHLVFRHEPGLRCSAGRVAPGVDVRADGGYVIWWPAAALPVLCAASPAPWPAWLRESPRPRPVGRRIVVPDDAALMRLVRVVATGRPGERNRLTFWAACRVGEMVSSGLLGDDAAVAIIVEAASRAGLPLAEAQRTVRSGLRAGHGGGHV